MKKRLLAITLALSMLLLSCACGSTKTVQSRKDTNEIIVGISQDLGDSLDPYQMSSAGTREILTNVYEGLYKPNAAGDYIPAIAEDCIISEDGLTYTFKIRSGVKFHNGQTLTIEDILYSFKAAQERSLDSSLPNVLKDLVFTTPSEGNTIGIQLKEANNDFLAYVALVYIIPKDYDNSNVQPIGTGPYKFESRSVQENVILTKNNDYYGTPAKLDKITCKIYEDTTAMITALNAGAIDFAAHLPLDYVRGLGEKFNVLEGTMNLVEALYLNNAREPFNDKRVREALCYAINVDQILNITAEGHGTKLGTSIYPSFEKYFDESLVGYWKYDPEKAKDLLAEACPNGLSMSVTVPSNYTPHVNVGAVIVQQLQAVGIKAELKEVEWNTWLTDVYQGRNFDSTVSGFDASTLTANALLSRWVSGAGKNMIGFSNKEYDDLMAKANASVDDAERTKLYKEASAILTKEAANVYIQDLADFTAINKDLAGFEFYPIYKLDFSTICYR